MRGVDVDPHSVALGAQLYQPLLWLLTSDTLEHDVICCMEYAIRTGRSQLEIGWNAGEDDGVSPSVVTVRLLFM